MHVSPLAPDNPGEPEPITNEARLRRVIADYLSGEDIARVEAVLDYVRTLGAASKGERAAAHQGDNGKASRQPARAKWEPGYVISVARVLADTVHVDAVSLGAVLVYQAVELGIVTPADVRTRFHGAFGDATAGLIESIERFDALQRPAALRRRNADRHVGADRDPTRERRRERLRREQAEDVRKMFVGMAEDPRVVIFKIADQLCTMRAVREEADRLRTSAGTDASHADGTLDVPGGESLATAESDTTPERAAASVPVDGVPEASWTLEECLAAAEETRALYAPLAGRLGMGRMESELEDLAFAVLEPEAYRWLSEAVAEEKHQRSDYVTRVCGILREEMARIGVHAEVSGRVKHLYSIYRKVQRTDSREISQLYDIIAVRLLVDSVAECYLALGHVHLLWRPKDGRIKDFIANPKPNGYQSLHTTVFCFDDRMVEVQIRTHEQHEIAEFGVAMHWHYKELGDTASAQAPDLQRWIKQVMEWQQDINQAPHMAAVSRPEPMRSDEVIYVFTPAGDPKELPAGATPLDFAYRVHSDVGNRTAGARVTTEDGRLVTRMVPLDYELKNGDTIEIITQKNAHPTRDWLQFARTKAARTHIGRYLKAHERHIDQQIGRDQLDRDLRLQGLRGGIEDLRDDDLLWTARELRQPDIESLLVALGTDKLRSSVVIAKLRERIPERFPPPPEPRDSTDPSAESVRAPEPQEPRGVDVAGVGGLYTRLASCCSPVPGDDVEGFITRGRGVVVHRADCATLAVMLAREPERAVAVSLSTMDEQQTYRVPIILFANDRSGLLADVTGVISNLKLNMVKVTTVTNPAKHSAAITAVLELHRVEQLDQVLRALLGVKSVLSVERKHSRIATTPDTSAAASKRARK